MITALATGYSVLGEEKIYKDSKTVLLNLFGQSNGRMENYIASIKMGKAVSLDVWKIMHIFLKP